MVGVLGLAIWGLAAFVTLRTARNFLLNLQRAKRTGLPYVIGRKLALDMLYAGLLCEELAQHGDLAIWRCRRIRADKLQSSLLWGSSGWAWESSSEYHSARSPMSRNGHGSSTPTQIPLHFKRSRE